ncbi:unnamed protein product, partial [Staurois parvus]
CKCRFSAALSSRCQIVRKSTAAENRQLSEQGSAPIIRALMISADDRRPTVPPASSAHLCPAIAHLCSQQCTHLCPAVHPPVPLCSVTHLCPEVPPTCAQQCHPPVPTHLCPPV